MKHAPLLALSLCAACALPGQQPLETVPPSAAHETRLEAQGPPAIEPRLYARDGSVVTPRSAGSVSEAGPAQREVQGSEGSRYYMLELYQQVVDERDALSAEVGRLGADLDASRARRVEMQGRLAELETALAERDAELERLRNDNVELAGRLTTAQIRRLQAEKLLLESRIEAVRTPASAPAPGSDER